jgi:hypothetical protein
MQLYSINIIRIPVLSATIAMVFFLYAQSDAKVDGTIRYNLAVFDEGTMIPIYSGFTSNPIHPGLLIGAEYYYRKSRSDQLVQTVNLAGYLHHGFENGLFLNTDFGYRHSIPLGITGEILLGIGYLHTFSDNYVFEQNEDGRYVKTANRGNPRFMADASIGLGYDFSMKTRLPIQPYLRYSFFMEMPWAKGFDSFLMAHTALQIGCLFPIALNQTKAGKP